MMRRWATGLWVIVLMSCGRPPATSEPPPPVTAVAVEDAAVVFDAARPTDAEPTSVPVDAAPPDAAPVVRRPVDHVHPLRARCPAETFGGWKGTPRCKRLAERKIRGEHRKCQSDADCELRGASCHRRAYNSQHTKRYETWTSCTAPGAGACSGPTRAICYHGCCTPDYGLGMP